MSGREPCVVVTDHNPDTFLESVSTLSYNERMVDLAISAKKIT